MNNSRIAATGPTIGDAYHRVVKHCKLGNNVGRSLMDALTKLNNNGFEVTNIILTIRRGDGFDDNPRAHVVLYNGKYHAMVYPNGFTCFGYYSNKYDSQIINFMNTIIQGDI